MSDDVHAAGTHGAQRVFFALWPEAPARAALTVEAHAIAQLTQGRATATDRLHLTLAFIGNASPPQVATLVTAGCAAAEEAVAFTLSLDRVGMFRNTGIAWAAASAIPPELTRIVALLRESLLMRSFEVECRGYQAHVTLARRCRRPLPGREIMAIACRVQGMTLTASAIAHNGPRYGTLAHWPFGSGA